jgi:light-regulated signal transduction histidine kinase (bacteriophytochrome)
MIVRLALELTPDGGIRRVLDAGALGDSVEEGGRFLDLARRIVEAHGGELRVTSELGVGSTFTALLPFRRPGEAAGGVAATS